MSSNGNPNGCGPWWVSKRFKDTYFNDACTVHDLDYLSGENREYSDKKFYDLMKSRIRKDETLNYWQRKARFAQAWSFYWIVRLFGWTSHRDGLDL